MTAKEIVTEAMAAIFKSFDAEKAAGLLADDYIQHNPGVPNGAAPVLGLIPALRDSDIRVTAHRTIAEDDLVVLHSTYENAQAFGADTLVAFDVFRVESGRVAEHWDNLQAPAGPNPSGRSMTDGATEIGDLARTEENKALVLAFVRDVLRGEAPDRITEYVSTESYAQHNPGIADGLEGLGAALAAMAEAGLTMTYAETPIVVAEGNFVFTASRGSLGGTPTAFFDLFRVDGGKLVEHWDVLSTIPPDSEMAHGNGKF